jgi:hypothetical protein
MCESNQYALIFSNEVGIYRRSLRQAGTTGFVFAIAILQEVEMPQTLHAPHFSFHLPKLSTSDVGALEFVVCGLAVLALVVVLAIEFPLGGDNRGDDGTYIAAFQH